MKRLVVILGMVVALVGFMTAGIALAITYNGALYEPTGPSDIWNTYAENPSLGTPSGTPTATFQVSSINFNQSAPTSYGQWLNNSFTVVTEPSSNWIQNTPFYTPVTNGSPYQGTFFQFTWTETFSTSVLRNITLFHDDGAYLAMDGGMLIDSSAPTTAIPSYYTGIISAGVHNFVLNYGGVNGFPEVLQYSASTSPVPLPPSALLLGSGLLGVGLLRWRRKNQV
jgi:hypothetical protein